MNKVKVINELLSQVELGIYDLKHFGLNNQHRACVPITPLKDWQYQMFVDEFKDILRKRFGQVLMQNSLDKRTEE